MSVRFVHDTQMLPNIVHQAHDKPTGVMRSNRSLRFPWNSKNKGTDWFNCPYVHEPSNRLKTLLNVAGMSNFKIERTILKPNYL